MKDNFALAMKKAREKVGITQTQLAIAVNRSPQMICDIESGRKNPGLDTLISIAKVLNMSLDDIFLK